MEMRHIRQAVMALYPNATWHRRVHGMPDEQVFAIYKRSQEPKKKEVTKNDEYHQIDIWEYLNEEAVK